VPVLDYFVRISHHEVSPWFAGGPFRRRTLEEVGSSIVEESVSPEMLVCLMVLHDNHPQSFQAVGEGRTST